MAEKIYKPEELKTLFEALSIAPGYLSKRFIMKELLGWDDRRIEENVRLKNDEDQQSRIGNKTGGYR